MSISRWLERSCNLVAGAAVALVCAVAAAMAAAQDTPSPVADSGQREVGEFQDFEELELEDLLNRTVSIAAGTVQRVEEAPAIVSVITEDDIRRMGLQTLADALATVPGFDVITDNLGRQRIVVRGVNPQGIAISENVLVLFNGYRLNDHMWGGAMVSNPNIRLQNIKQIELIRGPGSALFGTYAFVGVINLVPHTATTFNGIQASGGGGSFHSGEASATAGRTWGALGLVGSAAHFETSGPALLVEVDAQTLLDRFERFRAPISLAPTTTRGGHRNTEASLNLTYHGLAVDARVIDTRIDGYIGPFDIFGVEDGNQFNSRQVLIGVRQRVPMTSRTTLSAAGNFVETRGEGISNAVPPGWVRVRNTVSPSVFPEGLLVEHSENTRRYWLEGAVEQRFARQNQLTAAVGYERESTFGLFFSANFDPVTGMRVPQVVRQPWTRLPQYSREITSAFVQNAWNPSAQVGFTLGLRFDHYSDFGNAWSPRVGVVWRPRRFVYVKGLYGHAFRAPTIAELFMTTPLRFAGNPDLQPSTSDTYEVSAGYRSPRLTASATYFVTDVDDLIRSDRPFTVTEGTSTPFNGPPVRVHGLELEARRNIGLDHLIFGNYTYQRPQSDDPTLRFAGVPAHMGTLGATVGFGRFVDVTATTVLRSERPRLALEDRPAMDGYAVTALNIRAKELRDLVELSLTVDNLFDVKYSSPAPDFRLPGDYPRPGRSIMARARFKY